MEEPNPPDNEFCACLVATWTPDTTMKIIQEVAEIKDKLSMVSPNSEDWNVEVILKLPKSKDSKVSWKVRHQSSVIATVPLFFVKFLDSRHLVLVPKVESGGHTGNLSGMERSASSSSAHGDFSKNSLSKEDKYIIKSLNEEEEATKDRNLAIRTLWRASGKRFIFGDFVVSVGIVEHAGNPCKCVLEVIYSPEKVSPFLACEDQEELANVASGMKEIVQDLVSESTTPRLRFIDDVTIQPTINNRALQWVIQVH